MIWEESRRQFETNPVYTTFHFFYSAVNNIKAREHASQRTKSHCNIRSRAITLEVDVGLFENWFRFCHALNEAFVSGLLSFIMMSITNMLHLDLMPLFLRT